MRIRFFVFVIFILPLLFNEAHAEFRVGIASRIVTPDPLLPVSGGIGPSNPTHTKKGELVVRALVLSEGDTSVAIVSTDFLGFPAVLGDRVRAKIDTIPPENILIGATHTHSAPDCYGFPNEKGEMSIDLKYLDRVCAKIVEAIQDAIGQFQPAHVRIGTGEAKGKIAYNYYAEKLYDPRCHVIQALDLEGHPIATLINYAVHPEVLGSGQGIISPDLVGPLYDRIEAKGGGTGIFINGALGGMVTADCRGADGKDIQTWEECIRIGEKLADESLRIIADAPIQKNPQLRCESTTIFFPIDSPIMQSILRNSPLNYPVRDDNRVPARINAVNLGNAQILTIPGEALPNIGYYLKRKMYGEHNFLFGLTNDAFGYILTKEDFDSFERYEYITRTSLGEMTGEIFVDAALKFVNRIPKPARLGQ